ncbi:MAG: HD domain-containing protein [Methanomicrobiales archaeon]|nr:HD domain-containing protein [Methanomicrobiales archaeon]
MKFIKDPVHGFVQVPVEEEGLLDSMPVQRLRHIRQLGFAYLVYPGANHSRFEHALGTMHLASIACTSFGLDGTESRAVAAAALLHDCGHGPFSHATEPLMKEYLDRGHEDISALLDVEEIGRALLRAGVEEGTLISILEGRDPLSGIIHGELDVDRMDYLLRDAHYTGVPYGTVDPHRLIQSSHLTDGGIVLDEGGVNAAESLLIARTLMRPAVYLHHVSRIASSMLSLAIMDECRQAQEGLRKRLESLMAMDDAALMYTLLHSESQISSSLAAMLYRRHLYKRALYVGPDQVDTTRLQREGESFEKSRRIAAAIALEAGVAETQVLVDIPRMPPDLSLPILVRNRHDAVPLEDISPLVDTLNRTRRAQWRAGVYTLPEIRDRVSQAAMEVLRVKRLTKQDRLSVGA